MDWDLLQNIILVILSIYVIYLKQSIQKVINIIYSEIRTLQRRTK